jgi:hypothetical protein
MSSVSRKVLIHKFRKLFRNLLSQIMKDTKTNHIIYEEDSFDDSSVNDNDDNYEDEEGSG